MTLLFQQKDQNGTEMGKIINLIKKKAGRILWGNLKKSRYVEMGTKKVAGV